MFEKEKKLPLPGDKDYLGGIFNTTVVINGESKNVRTEKDMYGNIVSVIVTDKIFGIF